MARSDKHANRSVSWRVLNQDRCMRVRVVEAGSKLHPEQSRHSSWWVVTPTGERVCRRQRKKANFPFIRTRLKVAFRWSSNKRQNRLSQVLAPSVRVYALWTLTCAHQGLWLRGKQKGTRVCLGFVNGPRGHLLTRPITTSACTLRSTEP